MKVHEAASTLMIEFMSLPGDCSQIAAIAIKIGYYQHCLDLLLSANYIAEVLFSLSNMVAENCHSAESFFRESALVNRVMEMTNNSNIK